MTTPDQPSRPNGRLTHLITRSILTIVVAGAIVGTYLYWQHNPAKPEVEQAAAPAAPPTVHVATVQEQTVPMELRYLGQMEASQRVEIRARIPGFLEKRAFDEGARVEAGSLLFQIDARPFEAAIQVAQARVARAEATLFRAQQQVKRFRELVAREAAVASELEQWETDARAAAAEVQLASAQLTQARLDLSYTRIEAPIAGTIGEAMKDVGTYVDATSNGLLALLEQVDPIYLRFPVSEQDLLHLRRQEELGLLRFPDLETLEIEVHLADGAAYAHRGRINFVDVRIEPTTGTAIVRATVPNPEHKLKPGQFAHARILGIERIKARLVPQKAVMQSPAGASVYVVGADGMVSQRAIALGPWHADQWIIDSGLEPGDRVVLDQLLRVRPGQPVNIANDALTGTQP